MASPKFLEEALSTDVDESAVSAIVGSLETQLATSTSAAPEDEAPKVASPPPEDTDPLEPTPSDDPPAVAVEPPSEELPAVEPEPEPEPQAAPEPPEVPEENDSNNMNNDNNNNTSSLTEPALAEAAEGTIREKQDQVLKADQEAESYKDEQDAMTETGITAQNPAVAVSSPGVQNDASLTTNAISTSPILGGGGGGGGGGSSTIVTDTITTAPLANNHHNGNGGSSGVITSGNNNILISNNTVKNNNSNSSDNVAVVTTTSAPSLPISNVDSVIDSVASQQVDDEDEEEEEEVSLPEPVKTVMVVQQQQQMQQMQQQQLQQQLQLQHLQQQHLQQQIQQQQQQQQLPQQKDQVMKVVYSSGQGTKLASFPTQLANGGIGVQAQAKQQQQTIAVLKPGAAGQQGMVLPMQGQQVKVSAAGMVPGNVQILNMNTIRPTTQVTGQQVGKASIASSRVVIGGPHMQLQGRPGAQGLTLQAIQGLQGTPGHLLLKTENGYQLVRVGPAPAAQQGTQAGTAVQANSLPTNTVVAAVSQGVQGTTTTYRLTTVPAVSRLNAHFAGPALTTIRKPAQTVPSTVTTTTAISAPSVGPTPTLPAPVATPVQQAAPTQPQARQATDNTKEKCRKFLANLLELSSREPKQVERNVRTLIQELIDVKVEPEEFCVRLEKLLNASPQPCLIGFLRKSLPLLRQSLVTGEMIIDGIRAPPPNVVFSIASTTPVIHQNQVRPAIAVSSMPPAVSMPQPPVATTPIGAAAVAPAVASVAPPVTPTVPNQQIRVMGPGQMPAISPPVPRPPIIQQQPRLVRPTTSVIRTQVKDTTKISMAPTIRTPPVKQKPTMVEPPPVQDKLPKIVNTIAPNKPVPTITQNKVIVPSIQPKTTIIKDKEKKNFSSAGYTGDDDINDVAAMGGVNLAEESQRILGSTKFVGTHIRSCKDEVFLHLSPLQQKINQIVSSHGLEEPNGEVASLISHAAQERLKNLVEKLSVIAEHRIDLLKVDPRYEVTQDVRAQLKFLEELDKVERKKHEEQEREMLLRAAKSRAKTEDPEHAKLKAKAKEMQKAEMEELRQREANLTALQAIGPRKKPKLDNGGPSSNPNGNAGLNSMGPNLNRQMPLRPRLKRVNFRDLLFLLEQEKETCRSTTLYRSFLK